MNSRDFSGAKLAVMSAGKVLTLQRDEKAGIAYPGLWDLPGGAREPGETPVDCALRECMEEAGLRIAPGDVISEKVYPGVVPGQLLTWFLVAEPGWLVLPAPRLGREGRDVRWMGIDEFLNRGDAVPHLQHRLREFLGPRAPVGARAVSS